MKIVATSRSYTRCRLNRMTEGGMLVVSHERNVKTEIERRREGRTGVVMEQREGDGSEEGREHTGTASEEER